MKAFTRRDAIVAFLIKEFLSSGVREVELREAVESLGLHEVAKRLLGGEPIVDLCRPYSVPYPKAKGWSASFWVHREILALEDSITFAHLDLACLDFDFTRDNLMCEITKDLDEVLYEVRQ